MEKLYLQHIPKSDRLKFHYRELFDDLRDIKLALSILFCAIAVFETIQSLALPSEVTIESKGESFITGIAYCLACCCYLVTMLKFFESLSPRRLRIRYGLLVLAVLIATGGAFALMSESHNIIIVNNPKDFVLTIISQKTELWIILLVDLIVPVWPLKLLLPIAFWSPVIVEYYRSNMPYKETLWVRFILSFSYIFCIFALKGHIKWRNFQKHLNLQAWSEIQTSILNKMPEAIGVVNTDYKIIYSNSSFKGLCNNNIKDIGQRIVDIKKVTAFRTGNNQTDSEPKKSRIFFDETKHVFMNEEDPRNNINAMSDHFLDLNDLLEEVMYYLSNGSFNEDDYVVFKGKYKTLDGSPPLSYEVKISPLLNFKKCIIILSDTTQREKAADLEGVNQYKDKLLATVSHDLRAPINGTLTFLQETLDHQDVPSTIKEQFLIPAQRSCQFLLHLVNDVLDFSQINAQKLRMSFESLSIAETIRNCHHLLQVQANHKKIAFPLILDDRLPKYFTTDHNRLSQIILNLLTNAIKFTSKGEVSLKAKVINAFMIEIIVADTGIGIKDEDQKRLFQEFTRIDYAQPNMNTRGVGLGLVIANELAKMLGPTTEEGGIKVQSIYEQGSTFSFLVRDKSFQRDRSLKEEKKARMGASGYQQFDPEMRKKSKGNSIIKHGMYPSRTGELTSTDQFNSMVHIPPSSKFNVRNPNSEFESAAARPIRIGSLIGRVLVVDDDPFNILALESQLKRYGLIVDAAYNGQEAIEKIIKNRDQNDHSKESQRTSEEGGTDDVPEARYDIIFMDCEMPIMNGLEGSKILSGMMRKGEIETIPIIGCTGHRDSEIIEKCFENGMSDVLNKPVAREKLRECLYEFLELDI